MNEIVNVTSTNPSASVVAGKSQSATKAAIGGAFGEGSSSDTAEPNEIEHSFSDSLSKVNAHTDTEKHDSDTGEDGKLLPTLAEAGQQVANDDPLSLAAVIETVLNHSEESSAALSTTDAQISENQLISQVDAQLHSSYMVADADDTVTSLPIDTIVKAEVKTSQLSSSMQSVAPELTKSGTAKISPDLNSSNNEKLELPQMNLDDADLNMDKKFFSALSRNSSQNGLPMQQLHMLNEIQGSLSQRLEASPVTSRIDTVSMPLTQAANASPLNIQSSPVLGEVNVPFNSPDWSKAMGKQIVWMANQNIKAAEIRLNPANLGPVEVRLEINDDQINVALSSRHANVREAMEMTMPKLREMLENDGLNLSDSNISHQSFAEQREQQAESQRMDKVNQHLPHIEQESVTDDVVMQKMTSTSMVDYFI